MTTQQDWLFRADYMELQARGLEERAKLLNLEAERYRHRAKSCYEIASQHGSQSKT